MLRQAVCGGGLTLMSKRKWVALLKISEVCRDQETGKMRPIHGEILIAVDPSKEFLAVIDREEFDTYRATLPEEDTVEQYMSRLKPYLPIVFNTEEEFQASETNAVVKHCGISDLVIDKLLQTKEVGQLGKTMTTTWTAYSGPLDKQERAKLAKKK
jgi:hypothetical protein